MSALSIQDPRERPLDKQQAADEAHRQFQDSNSDFTALLGLSTLWLGCGTLARDIEDCSMQVVAVKPVPRWQPAERLMAAPL